MNKASVKTYAIWARNELISRVSQKAYEYGVEKNNIVPFDADSINGRLLSNDEKNKRRVLITQVNQKGYEQVMEEAAYTWFNRFIALRFMEVNNYLPNKVRLFTNENNEFKPQILEEALHIDLLGLDKDKVIALKEANNNEDLYKELLLATCNDMSQYLPGMFKPIDDYMTLLFPSNLLRDESVLGRLITDIDEDSWSDQVQIIGWLYQYYISEKHSQIIDIYKGTISKEDIPAATQLFTTDWVVRYMVDNTLGRYLIEQYPQSTLKNQLHYYDSIRNDISSAINNNVSLKSIKFFDPCMGSGHILVYAFDVFMQIYLSEGWTEREAAKSILQNNIYGLDIDERAYQLSYFSLMMKARQYNRRILTEGIVPNVMAIEESNTFNKDLLCHFGDLAPLARKVIDVFHDAKEYGSILNVEFTKDELDSLDKKLAEINEASSYENIVVLAELDSLYHSFLPFLKQAKIMSQKYECVVTNPPYLSRMEGKLKKYVSENYKDYSSDLFAVFVMRNLKYSIDCGYLGFMTPFVWLSIKSYIALREHIINYKSLISLIQFEYSAYEEATVPICSFVLQNKYTAKLGLYYDLTSFIGGMEVQKNKYLDALNNTNCDYFYKANQKNFLRIPSSPITAYWASENLYNDFEKGVSLSSIAYPRQGMATTNNNLFLRMWYEPLLSKVGFHLYDESETYGEYKWFPYNKGGEFRKWYGNNDFVVNFQNGGKEVCDYIDSHSAVNHTGRVINRERYFKPSVTWSKISSGNIAFRYKPHGFIFDVAGTSIFGDDRKLKTLAGFLNSSVANKILKSLSPTLNYEVGHIGSIPILDDENETAYLLVNFNISLSKSDWDSFEISWDYKKHPLIRGFRTIKESYEAWDAECLERFNQLKTNEEELNRIFIDIYGLQEELTPEVADKDVTVRKANLQREIKSLISYAVGCMFGRYSLDVEGIAYAGGEWDDGKYKSFIPDKDNIIPICDDEYFEDDIVGKFIDFIKAAYGEETLEENLQFIADALGVKGSSREVIRNFFINDFYNDHLKIYQKRPIYWQFSSGKKNGFKALVYIHRYTPDLIARMRTSYVHEQQSRYENQISMIQNRIDNAGSTSERVKAEKELKKLKEQSEELRVYEEKIHHWADKMEPMDLDDGVKANYAKFQELLTKIK